MPRIVVIGATGYAGHHILTEAVSRGHVVSVSRSAPENPVDGVLNVQGTVLDLASLGDVFDGMDAVVSALSPCGDIADAVLGALEGIVATLDAPPATLLGVIGGAGGSLIAPGGPRLFDQGFPDEYKHEAQVGIDSLALLERTDAGLDWFFIHPAEEFGVWAEGGAHRTLPGRRGRDRPRRRREVRHLRR